MQRLNPAEASGSDYQAREQDVLLNIHMWALSFGPFWSKNGTSMETSSPNGAIGQVLGMDMEYFWLGR